MMKKEWLKKVFYSMIVLFVLLMTFFVLPGDKRRSIFIAYAILALIFLILGVVLIVLAVKSKEKKLMKIFLIMMGGAAGGILVGSVLHNMFYAFGIMSENMIILPQLFEVLHVAFFLISLIGCPLAFLVGMIGAIWLWVKESDQKNRKSENKKKK